MQCLYCRQPGPFDEDHVLTRALAGAGEDAFLLIMPQDYTCSSDQNGRNEQVKPKDLLIRDFVPINRQDELP